MQCRLLAGAALEPDASVTKKMARRRRYATLVERPAHDA